MYKMRCIVIALLSVVFLFLNGCQKDPEKESVVNKNSEYFDIDDAVAAEGIQSSIEIQDVDFTSSFDSTDGSVHFVMEIDQTIPCGGMPLVKVSPHYITETDAERVANALFPEADFYEAEPLLEPILTKSEIQDKISLWSQYTNIDSLREIYGDDYGDDFLESTVSLVKRFIEQYTVYYESAPEGYTHSQCAWEMKKSSEYMYAENNLAGVDMSNDNDEISAQCYIDGVPYYYTATTRNKADYKVNMLSCVVYGGQSPRSIEDRILFARLCRTEEPTEELLVSIRERVVQILLDMNLGQWKIDECKVEKQIIGDKTEYNILVNAVPVFNGVAAIRCPQLESLRNQDGYAASQYITDANFNFSGNGELLTFRLYTPLNMEDVVYEYVKTMDMDSLLIRAQEALTLTDAYHYSFGSYLQLLDEDVQCNIEVSELEYGLSRVKVKNEDDTYYYVPAILLKGCVEYVGKTSGKVFYVSESPEILLHINALDGSIINETNS